MAGFGIMGETKAVRKGEEIDIDSLRTYLKGQPSVPDGEIEVEQFPGGSSNLTYLIRLGRMEFVLRRPPFGNTVKSAHDMQREFDVLTKLSAVYEPAPRPLLFCKDQTVIGSEFYLMERRQGLIIRGKIPGTHPQSEPPAVAGGLSSDTVTHESVGGNASVNERAKPSDHDPDFSGTQSVSSSHRVNSPHVSKGSATPPRTLENDHNLRLDVCRSFIQNLADLHSLDLWDAKLETLGKPDGYNRRQVEGWTKRYFAAKTGEVLELESTIAWLNENIPNESGASLIHNDYKFDNIMLDPSNLTRITAVLDWEMVTIGDPLMDLGTTLGYWIDRDAPDWLLTMPFNPRVLMENITRQDLVDMYANALGHAVPNMLFYYVFGTFKIAVIAQQIYARYVKGFTKDARFATFDKFVAALGRIAARAIETGKI